MAVLIMALAVFTGSTDLVTVTLPEQANVPLARLHVGDIAVLDGGDAAARDRLAAVDLGRGPRLGFPRVISRTGLTSYLTSLGISRDSFVVRGAVSCRVTLRAAEVSSAKIVEAARSFASRELAVASGERVELEALIDPPSVQVPDGAGTSEIEVKWASAATAPSLARLRVSLLVDGQPFDSVPVDLRIRRFATVLVTDEKVARDADLSQAALLVREREVTRVRGTPLSSLAQVEDRRSRRALPAGTVLTLEDTVLPAVVRRSDLVTIVYRKAGMSVETRGMARGDGAPGEVITVINVDSKKTLRCRVEGAGVVSVLH